MIVPAALLGEARVAARCRCEPLRIAIGVVFLIVGVIVLALRR